MRGISFVIVFVVVSVVPFVSAQQGGYYGRGDERYYEDERRYYDQQQQQYAGGGGGGYGYDGPDDDDNLYANYAARQNQKALGRNHPGWIKIVVAGIGGYVIGATIHSRNKANIPKLRFKVKQRVQCKVQSANGGYEWRKGTITKVWHQEKKMPGEWMAYQV